MTFCQPYSGMWGPCLFRLGRKDAIELAPILQPEFSSLDTVGLPNWQGYARMQLNGDSTPPFSFRTIKDEIPYNEKAASRIRHFYREKFGMNATCVDKQILKRRSIWNEI